MRNRVSLVAAAFLAMTTLCIAQPDTASKAKAKPADGHADQAIVDNSRATWEAYKSKDIAAMKALTADDYAAYTLAGPSNLQQDIADIKKLTISSFTIDEPKVTWVTKDVAILRYKCDLKGSFEGKPPFKPVYASEVWVNRGGKWRIISYTETPVG